MMQDIAQKDQKNAFQNVWPPNFCSKSGLLGDFSSERQQKIIENLR